jgi:type IV pilus assembly protein PilA
MKTEIKAKFLQHILSKKNNNEGFTLIELLVVIIIIGILSAIALPSFLNQANKAKQSEAKTYIGSLNRAQQAYYAENNVFAANADFPKLGLGINTSTTNYNYAISGGGTGVAFVTNQAQPAVATSPIKAYVGGVGTSVFQGSDEATTVTILCEADKPISVDTTATGQQDVNFTPSSSGVAAVITCPTSPSYTALK